ncbi:MAG: hypothetical protein V7641_204 [Blastocatellia bacterium]
METKQHYDVVVIGTGFGGSMTALTLARDFKKRSIANPSAPKRTIHMLERGTWWTTPVGTVQDKEAKTADYLREQKQPVQYWSSVEHFRGFLDIFLRCVRRKKNEDGLYDLTQFRRTGFLGLFGNQNDGVTILRANGVGGGSLIYANVTIQPPDFIFEDPRWPVNWNHNERNKWFDLARDAIGYSVRYAWDRQAIPGTPTPDQQNSLNQLAVNTGLSNISTRSARLDPHWAVRVDPSSGKEIKTIKLTTDGKPKPPDTFDQQLGNTPTNRLWIDRARVFQTVMAALTKDFGTVDSSINDLPPEKSGVVNPAVAPKNYCERQGRCIIGCLPGARHTLNKQLMAAALGTPASPEPAFKDILSITPLAEVDVIRELDGGGYAISYLQRDADDPSVTTTRTVTADRVIVAAGCVGTTEIMLRSKKRNTLRNLSDRVGYNFSTNGDYLAFVEGTIERVSLTRGPITTSFAHFNTPGSSIDPMQPVDTTKFHTIEDNGIPRALASAAGFGVPLIRSLSKGRNKKLFIIWSLLLWFINRIGRFFRAIKNNYRKQDEMFQSEDEQINNMMCVAAMGRDAAAGRFELGGGMGETPLRLHRTDGRQFYEDPIYDEIRATLKQFAERLTGDKERDFINPSVTRVAETLEAKSIALSHPLGGCPMAASAESGVVDEYGRVFYKASNGGGPQFYNGLYLADAAIIPTALGVNPSLTITALALRIADNIIQEIKP